MTSDNKSPISEYLVKLQLIITNTEFKNKNEANKYETLEMSQAADAYINAVNKTDKFESYQYDKKKYKDVKDNKDIVVSSQTVIPDENDLGTYYSSGAIVEKPQKDSNYDLNLPTTTAFGIAGEKVLDKLKLNKSTDVAKTDVNQSTATSSNVPSNDLTSFVFK